MTPQPETCQTVADDDCDGLANEDGEGCACVPGSTISCYSGPVETEGVGACKAGTQVCDAGGSGYGPCTDEVKPAFDDCATGADEDCDGLSPGCPGTHLWSKRFGNGQDQLGRGVAADTAGNVIITGEFYGTISFGPGLQNLHNSSGGPDAFLAKFDPDGNHLWSKRFGDGAEQFGNGVVVDGAGNVIVVGNFGGTIDLGGGLLPSGGMEDIFIAKFDGSGGLLWSTRVGGPGGDIPTSVAVDATDNILLAGTFMETIDFGDGPLASTGDKDFFLAKLSAAGEPLWSKPIGASGAVLDGPHLATGASGDVFLTARCWGTIDFGGGPLPASGLNDMAIAKWDGAGNHLWSKRFGDAGDQGGMGIATDSKGQMWVTGFNHGTVDLGGGPISDASGGGLYVAELDGLGGHLWSRGVGSSTGLGRAMATDGADHVVVAGWLADTADFGGGALMSAGGIDVFLAKLDGAGGHLWSKRFGDEGDQVIQGVAVDAAGNELLVGYFTSTLDFGGNALVSTGGLDVFLAKLAP